jgi:hypothetical protein
VSDENLRTLERLARESPDDAHVWARYARALQLAQATAPEDMAAKVQRVSACLTDSPSQAMIEVGDEVWVDEHDTPYIVGRWRGVVRAILFEPDELSGKLALRFRVRPSDLDDPESRARIKWRAGPRREWFRLGLKLSKEDRLELIARGQRPPG